MTGEKRGNDISVALYHTALGKMVLDYTERIHPTVIEKAMNSRAIQTLEAIRRVLEDKTFDDPECFYRIDALVMLFFRELEINIDRHNELE